MISLIASIQKKDRGLGYKNNLLYQISHDMKRFRDITMGNVVIMGRKTWESLPEKFRPLRARENIVITRDKNYVASGANLVNSIEDAFNVLKNTFPEKNCFIIGGEEIYKQTIARADRLYLTIIEGDKKADTFFPDYSDFKKVISKESRLDEKTGVGFEYVVLER